MMKRAFSKKPGGYLDASRACGYEPDLGFSIAVDGLNNLPLHKAKDPAAFYKVVTVVTPPGLYLQEPPVAEDAQFTLKHDWSCPLDAPRFLDGYRRFRDKPRAPSLCAVFEIRRVHAGDVKGRGLVVQAPTDSGARFWAALPLFKRPSRPSAFLAGAAYVDSGSFALPLFRAAPARRFFRWDSRRRGVRDARNISAASSRLVLVV